MQKKGTYRNLMAKNFIIYESRNRLTRTKMQTLDLRHAACPPQVKDKAKGKRYAAICVDHSVAVFFDEHYPAGRAIAHSGEAKRTPDDKENGWCPKCVAMVEKGTKVDLPKKEAVEAPPAPKGKRASNARANQAAQTKQTKAEKPSPVRTRRVAKPEPEVVTEAPPEAEVTAPEESTEPATATA
jgi:hypothetical protein